MYRRTIGRRFTEMIVYFLAVSTKPGSDNRLDHRIGSRIGSLDQIIGSDHRTGSGIGSRQKKKILEKIHKKIIILI